MNQSKLRYKLLLAFLAVVIFLGLAEMALEIWNLDFAVRKRYTFDSHFYIDPLVAQGKFLKDPILFWRLNPQYPFPSPGAINSKGFRDREFDIKKGKGIYRIICFGDSVTFGAPENKVRIEQVYPKRLEVLLNLSFPERHFEVINAGVPGHSSYQGLLYLKELLRKGYGPDLVAVDFGDDDAAPAVYYSDKEQHSQPLWVIKLQNCLINFKLYKFLCNLIILPKKADISGKEKFNSRVSYKEYMENINEMVKIAHKSNIEIVYITPLVFENRKIVPIYPFQPDIPRVNLIQRLKNFRGDLKDLFVDNCHFTPLGHQIVAEEIYKVLTNEGIIRTK